MSTITRQDLLMMMAGPNGVKEGLSQIQQAILVKLQEKLLGPEAEELTEQQKDNLLLNKVGPAAATAAIEYAIGYSKKSGLLRNMQFTGNAYHNLKMIQNDQIEAAGGYQNFSSVIRQFLLPRYAYLDFDRIVDPRHQIDTECGYPKWITPIMYRYMYDRDDVARKVVDFYPNETWRAKLNVYEDEDEETLTPFEEDWQRLCDDFNLIQYLYRIDRLCGIGHYGVLLLGVADGQDMSVPIWEEGLLQGQRRSVSTQPRQLMYLRPFDEYLSFIHQYETDTLHPRYGLPKFYNLVFLDMTIDAAGASIGTRLNRRVHWSRVIHVADNLQGSLVFGIPRQQSVFNRELDLRKIKGAGAEACWQGGFPGISWELDPQYVADNPEADMDDFKRQTELRRDGLQRDIFSQGIKANQLQPNIATDPQNYVNIQIEAIASNLDVPIRIWSGSEDSRIASPQDRLRWNGTLGRRFNMFVEPSIVRNTIDRFIAVGIMRPPKNGKYYVEIPDLNNSTDEDRANLALKLTQALSQYVSSGVIHFVEPVDYMITFLGMNPRDAKRLAKKIEASGGFEKLKAVSPDQGAGENGVRKNVVSKGDREGGDKPAKRETSDKKIEGKE